MAEVLCPFEPPGHQSIFSEPPPIAHADPHSSDTSAAPRLPHHPGAHGRVATAVDLVVTVCEAGALDFIAGAYTTPAQILETARAVRERTARPFGVNLFAPQPVPKPPEDTGRTLKRIGLYHVELGLPPPELPAPAPDPLEEPLSAVLESGASVFSFTFGPLPEAAVAAIKTRGMFLRARPPAWKKRSPWRSRAWTPSWPRARKPVPTAEPSPPISMPPWWEPWRWCPRWWTRSRCRWSPPVASWTAGAPRRQPAGALIAQLKQEFEQALERVAASRETPALEGQAPERPRDTEGRAPGRGPHLLPLLFHGHGRAGIDPGPN